VGALTPLADTRLEAPAAIATVAEFYSLCRRARAHPVLFVRYRREAYESVGPDPVRLTFDTQLEHCVANGAGLARQGHGEWVATPVPGAIIEIKFTQLFPSWVRTLIDELQLQKQSIPKYCLSLDHAMDSGAYRRRASTALDRTTGRSLAGRASWGL
jgi:hypothetical protein